MGVVKCKLAMTNMFLLSGLLQCTFFNRAEWPHCEIVPEQHRGHSSLWAIFLQQHGGEGDAQKWIPVFSVMMPVEQRIRRSSSSTLGTSKPPIHLDGMS